jgi:pimeloyl-ACP methyl ester carboxylesterase
MKAVTIDSGLIKIHAECFGEETNAAVLLIMGATAQGLMWDEAFCNALARAGYYVIRYDHRDTGKSSRVNYNENPYTLNDLKQDCLNILDYLKIKRFHVVGASMGSFIAQKLALEDRDRVLSLSCVMSSPNHQIFVDGFQGRDVSHHPLPASNPLIMEFYQEILSLNVTDANKDFQMHSDAWKKVCNCDKHVHMRVFEGKILKRLKNHRYIHNHSFALANSPDLYNQISKIIVPTLIIHGIEDYVLPFEHGKHLSEMIKGSKFIAYEGMGHCFSEEIYGKLVIDLISHFKQSVNVA